MFAGCRRRHRPRSPGARAAASLRRHLGASRVDPIGTLGTPVAGLSAPAPNSRLLAALVANRAESSVLSQPIARRLAEKCSLREEGGLVRDSGEKGPPEPWVRALRGSLGQEVGNIQLCSRFECLHARLITEAIGGAKYQTTASRTFHLGLSVKRKDTFPRPFLF